MIRIISILFLLIAIPLYAGTVATFKTYNTGDLVTANNLNGNFNNIRNPLNGGLDNNNADTDGGFRFIEVLAALPAAGNQGRVVFDTGTNTLNFDTGVALIATGLLPNNQTWTGNNTFTGIDSFIDFTATTVDINGGAIDGTTVGSTVTAAGHFSTLKVGTTTQGEILYDNGTSFVRLGVGTTGPNQVLQTRGASANPLWGDDVNEGNVIYHFQANVDESTDGNQGTVISNSLTPTAPTKTFRYYGQENGTQREIYKSKWTKTSGVDFATVYGQIWQRQEEQVTLHFDIGTTSGSVAGTDNIKIPEWVTFKIDVSSLADGTTFDVFPGITSDGGGTDIYMGTVIVFGSKT